MEEFESNTHSFIVKVWREEAGRAAGQATWRGHITHVPSGQRRHVKNLDDILAFIVPYLERMGIQSQRRQQTRRWLRRWISFLTRRR